MRSKNRKPSRWREDTPPRDAFDQMHNLVHKNITIKISTYINVGGSRVHTWYRTERVAWKSGQYKPTKVRLRKSIDRA